jgi:hypothetical protein
LLLQFDLQSWENRLVFSWFHLASIRKLQDVSRKKKEFENPEDLLVQEVLPPIGEGYRRRKARRCPAVGQQGGWRPAAVIGMVLVHQGCPRPPTWFHISALRGHTDVPTREVNDGAAVCK